VTGLDVADLIVIASEVLGCDTETALAQADIIAAEEALAQAGVAGASPLRSDAAEAAIALMDALLRHPPFPAHREEMAVAAGLQFLALNGWQANLDVPGAVVVVIGRLASAQVTPAQAASWLAARLSPESGLHAGPGHRRTMLPRGSPLTQIARAVGRRHRRGTRPSPLIIHIGPGEGPGGVITPVTGPMAFTGHARKALVLARQEASRSGRPRGPEHILLGLVNVGDGLGVQALERLGVRPETVREQVTEAAGQAPHPSGVGPEAPQSLRVWYAMVDEAVAHGDDYIGTEHFLLALFCDEGNAAARVLTRLGASEREVRAAVAELLAESGRERSA
jgi:prophage maintenance system killer protein